MPKIAGIMRVCNFVLGPLTATWLASRVDHLVLSFDVLGEGFDQDDQWKSEAWSTLFQTMNLFNNKLTTDFFPSPYAWPAHELKGGWHGELLAHLENTAPDAVIFLGNDEILSDGWEEDLAKLLDGPFNHVWFEAESLSDDGRPVPNHPFCRHVRMYKWHPGITAEGSVGFDLPEGLETGEYFLGKAKIQNLAFYTREMEKRKMSYYCKCFTYPFLSENIYGPNNLEVPWTEKELLG